MKYLLVLFILVVPCSAYTQATPDSTAIAQLLVRFYAALGRFDTQQYAAYCTSDYFLIENGEYTSDLQQELAYFKSNQGRKRVRKDSFDIRSITIQDKCAYAVYELRSAFTENGTTIFRHWIESCVFRKENEQWKVALLHSTRVKTDTGK